MTIYLTAEEVLIIHAQIVDATGGSHGVRDIGAVASLSARAQMRFGGTDAYINVFEKAAAYMHSCAMFHPFSDGNKRTSVAIAARFLYLNGYELDCSNEEMESYVVLSVVEHHEIPSIAAWLEKNSRTK